LCLMRVKHTYRHVMFLCRYGREFYRGAVPIISKEDYHGTVTERQVGVAVLQCADIIYFISNSDLILKREISHSVRSKSAEPLETNNDGTNGMLL